MGIARPPLASITSARAPCLSSLIRQSDEIVPSELAASPLRIGAMQRINPNREGNPRDHPTAEIHHVAWVFYVIDLSTTREHVTVLANIVYFLKRRKQTGGAQPANQVLLFERQKRFEGIEISLAE